MNGAIYALLANVCVAMLFASSFATVRLSYPQQRSASFFSAVYIFGMLTPLSELAVRFSDYPSFFAATSYGSFLLSITALVWGVASLAGRPQPVKACLALLATGIIARASIWNGPRNELWYELVYQAPFFAGVAMATGIAVAAGRRTRDPMWLVLSIVLGLMAIYFFTKPFFAAAFGSGASAKAYALSPYALFSQAIGGVLIVMAGLQILLMIVRSVLKSSIAEAETDALTGVANRRGFDRRAAGAVETARQTAQPLALILLDLDHFKRVNDGYGHATGDAVLAAFANVLVQTAPPSALIARIGGEEFVILLERTTLRGAWLTAQAIRNALPHLGGHLPAVTVSGGIAELKPNDNLETLLERADARGYEAKATGRNRIVPVPGPLLSETGLQHTRILRSEDPVELQYLRAHDQR